MTSNHLNSYIDELAHLNATNKFSLRSASEEFVNLHIKNFTHMDRVKGLLFGEVQSGKTAHMFGIIAATADADPGFKTFVLLTTNNRNLQQQTIRRAFRQLSTFNVCDETDDARFIHGGLSKPTLVILKKDPNVLKSWNAHLASASRLKDGPIFILDDEADNASLNTKVNLNELSRTFELIQTMRTRGTSSVYLEVTATPQSLLLQKFDSEIRPEFLQYFQPEPSYLGGGFFFTSPAPYVQVQISENEKADLLDAQTSATSGLKRAIATFLVTCAEFQNRGESNANFLVHPSIGKGDHSVVAGKIESFLQTIRGGSTSGDVEMLLFAAHQDLEGSCPNIIPFEGVKEFLHSSAKINVYLLNSSEEAERDNSFEEGFNIVIGGNTLGRGVTFSKLQTVYYVRSAKTPQADTYWQHSRMFGYDRHPELIRLFMPPSLFRTFRVFHEANEKLVTQLRSGNFDNIQIVLEKGFAPTRNNVLDKSSYSLLVGGSNYFPPRPNETNFDKTESLLGLFDDSRTGHIISEQLASELLYESKTSDVISWPVDAFRGAVNALLGQPKPPKIRLLTRRGRNISKDTGTLLSPDDRKLGTEFSEDILLTAYQLNGSKNQGWAGKPFWVLNVRLPEGMVYHRGHK
jgi:hypothetical protein